MLGTGIADPDLGGPLLGRITTTDIVIFENDDPYGRFHITGSSGESTVREQEAASVGVSLTVERQGGTIGSVQVTWSVTGGTATEGEDFAGQLLSGMKIHNLKPFMITLFASCLSYVQEVALC